MNAVIYARYSSARQREESIEDQLRVCNAYAQREDIAVVGNYCDFAVSGRTDDRPQFQQMISDAEGGNFDCIIVYKLDRFARDRYFSAKYKHQLKKHGVKVISATEGIPDSIEGIVMESVMEGMAEWYSANLSMNVMRGMMGNAEKCKANGVYIFGYQINKDGYYEPDPVTAPYVQQLFEKRLGGSTCKELADWLNSKGVKTMRNNAWCHNAIETVLKQIKYTGRYSFAGFVKDGGMPALIEEDVFYLVNNIKARKKNLPAPGSLSGKVFCGCGATMICTSGTSHTGKVHRYLSCKNARKGKCDAKNVPMEALEDFVFDSTVEYFSKANVMDDLLDALEAYANRDVDTGRVESLKAAKRDNERRQKNLLEYLEDGTDTAVRERLGDLRREHADLTSEITLELVDNEPPSRELMQFFIEDLLDDGALDDSKKERILSDFVSRVLVDKMNICIEFNYCKVDKVNKNGTNMQNNGGSPEMYMVRRTGFEPVAS